MVKPTGILWNKATKGRSVEAVAQRNAFMYFVHKNRDIQNFIFCSDNCSVQNKNLLLFTALTREVDQRKTAIHTITLKYFKPGHIFVSADSFHHRVEQ